MTNHVKLKYPLPERIGDPDLLVGRDKEFAYLQKWLERIPKRLSKSHAILARKKSGKTAIVQRIFNRLWTQNGPVIPFYLEIRDVKTWIPDFALDYYQRFVTQYISFIERSPKLVTERLSMEEIRTYGEQKNIEMLIRDVDEFIGWKKDGNFDLMWEKASAAPYRFANAFDCSVLVILDEFQNMSEYVYRDQDHEKPQGASIVGAYHELSESKIAPMLVTGSYVGWLVNVINKYLEAGRLTFYDISPYLSEDAGLQSVYQYANAFDEPITNETAMLVNRLCFSDPYFISCIIQSTYEGKDLTTETGVAETITYEIGNRKAGLARTWSEYINLSLSRINNKNAKHIVWFLTQNSGVEFTHRELKEKLNLDLDLDDILRELERLAAVDLILEGASDIAFKGLTDGSLNLILRNRFEEEITSHRVDLKGELLKQIEQLKSEKRSLNSQLNAITGKTAEIVLATDLRTRKRFAPSLYFPDMEADKPLLWTDIRTRWYYQRPDGKNIQFDIKAETADGDVLLIEVKKRKTPIGVNDIESFREDVRAYSTDFPNQTIWSAVLSIGGFTKEAAEFCQKHRIGTTTQINYVQTDWGLKT